jgi:hypothetical protein
VPDGSGVFTFANVPWGCWTFTLPFGVSSVHTGTVSTSSSTCLAAPTSSTPPTAAWTYTFNEHKLVITPTITPNTTPDAASSPSFNLTLANSTPHQVFSQTITTASTAITLYLPSDTYSLVMQRASGVSADMWPTDTNGSWSQTIHLSTASQTGIKVKAVEAHLATLNIPTYSHGGFHADATHVLTVTLTCTAGQGVPSGCGPTSTVTASDNGTVTPASFQLAPGNWDVDISGTAVNSGSVTQVLNVATQHLTLTAGGTTTVSW